MKEYKHTLTGLVRRSAISKERAEKLFLESRRKTKKELGGILEDINSTPKELRHNKQLLNNGHADVQKLERFWWMKYNESDLGK